MEVLQPALGKRAHNIWLIHKAITYEHRIDVNAGTKMHRRAGVKYITAEAVNATPSSPFQFDQGACFPVPTWDHAGHGAQRRGWEERSHAQHREHGEHRTFPVVSTVAG
jgi:hypothetical protein